MGWERIGRKPRSCVEPDEVAIKVVGKEKQNLTVMVGLDLAHQAGFEESEGRQLTVDLVIGTDEHIGKYKLCRAERGALLMWKNNRVDFKTSRVPVHMRDMKTRRTEIVSCEPGAIIFKVLSK